MNRRNYVFSIGLALLLASGSSAFAAADAKMADVSRYTRVELPLVHGWYNGQPVLYISTDTSDAGVAQQIGANYVPGLAGAIGTSAVDDIYTVTNFSQDNIVPSAPSPTGARNTNQAYSPLWQLSTVTWAAGVTPYTLKSEADVLAAAGAKAVTVSKTNIVINCPILYTPAGGKLPGVEFERP
jgi:hypothetical protein